MGNIGVTQLLIVLGLVILVFGTSKLKNMGKDLGGAVKGFKKAMTEEETATDDKTKKTDEGQAIEQKAEDASFETTKKSDETKS